LEEQTPSAVLLFHHGHQGGRGKQMQSSLSLNFHVLGIQSPVLFPFFSRGEPALQHLALGVFRSRVLNSPRGGREVAILKKPEALDAELLQEEAADTNAETEKRWPELAMFTDDRASTDELPGTKSLGRALLGGHQKPHAIQPRGIRCGICCASQAAENRYEKRYDSRKGYDFDRCPGGYKANGLRWDRPRPDTSIPGRKPHCSTPVGQARHH